MRTTRPMPRILRIGLLVVRVLPSLTMAIVAVALLSTERSSGYVRWMESTFNIQAQAAGLFIAAMALGALIWPLTAESIRRAPELDIAGMGVLVSPLWVFLGLTVYYTVFVTRTPATAIGIYIATFITQTALYMLSAGIRLWEMELTRGGD